MPDSDLIVKKRPSWKNYLGLHLFLVLLGVVIMWAGFHFGLPLAGPLIVLFGLVPFLLGLIHAWLVRTSTEYRLFQDSLEVESGIISRSIDNIQLFRVRDLGLSQGILGRMLDVGNVTVTSTDQSAPHLILKGVDDPRSMYDTLRDLVAKSRATQRTMILEEEGVVQHSAE
jgi:membrane protein YdbS with pleckstrin-like domain